MKLSCLRQRKRSTPPKQLQESGKGTPHLSCPLGNQTGEGWFLTGEMVELDSNRCGKHRIYQPFACLPNHVAGKGIIKELRLRTPKPIS